MIKAEAGFSEERPPSEKLGKVRYGARRPAAGSAKPVSGEGKIMKRITCIALSLLLLLSALPLTASAADSAVWNAKDKAFQLKKGPEIVRITADSNADGTRAMAYYDSTADCKTLADGFRAAFGNEDLLYAGALGKKAEDVEGDLEVGVQLAYSFDGVHWVND